MIEIIDWILIKFLNSENFLTMLFIFDNPFYSFMTDSMIKRSILGLLISETVNVAHIGVDIEPEAAW